MDKLIKKYRKHIASLFGVECNLLDVRLKTFGDGDMFCKSCPVGCNFVNTHLYGCYESVRWDNKYIYYCPGGYIFIAVPVMEDVDIVNEAIITGPLLMGDIDDIEKPSGLVHFETSKVNDLAELISGIFSPEIKSVSRGEPREDFLNSMYKELEAFNDYKNYPIGLEQELEESIKEGNSARAKEIINKLLGQIFFHSNGDFEIIKARVLELIVLLSRSAIEGGAETEQIFNLNNSYIKEIENIESLDRLNTWLVGVMNRFISYVFEFNDVKHADVIFKITAYVKNNYMKKITLDDIADNVYLSRTYISRIFREEMKVTLTKYINKIRIDKSKQLLLDSSLTLADVANLTGFDDQSYYSKTFRSITGMSPGKYREKHGIHKNN